MKIESWQLQQRQSLDLDVKIKMTKMRIKQWYDHWDGEVYVGFSGGKDSTVLLNLVRSMYPDVEAVFVDTGLEYPEIREFVKTFNNVTVLRPKMPFHKVIEKYGYPIISKSVSMAISRYRNTKDPIQKEYRKYGTKEGKFIGTAGTIPKKWHYLIDAPFKISEQCCQIMKKNPFKKFEKKSEKKPFIGIMAGDSNSRKIQYLREGCNVLDGHEKSQPLSFWLDKDIWNYIKENNLDYCEIYDQGVHGTGCIFCMYGVHLEKGCNRFQKLEKTHPKQHAYCMNNLDMKEILKYIKVPCKNIQKSLTEVVV